MTLPEAMKAAEVAAQKALKLAIDQISFGAVDPTLQQQERLLVVALKLIARANELEKRRHMINEEDIEG